MRRVIFPLVVDSDGVVDYPDDPDLFSVVEVIGDSCVANYSGGMELPLYTPPPPKNDSVLTQIQFEGLLPDRVQILLADPALAPNETIRAAAALLARRIALSQARTLNGDKGVDVNNPMTRHGIQEAVKLGLMTQAEVDEIFKLF